MVNGMAVYLAVAAPVIKMVSMVVLTVGLESAMKYVLMGVLRTFVRDTEHYE
jgi:hypothetical protein